MVDIDLIPEKYRSQSRFKKWFKQYVIYLLMVLLLLAGSYIWLLLETSRINEELKELQLKNNIAMQKKKQYEEQVKYKTELQQQLKLLNGLRSGVSVLQIFQTLDRVFKDDSVWFTRWKYTRSEYLLTDNSSVNAVYFMVITDKEKKQQEKWGIKINMNINGAALDYAALSDFVSRLIKQPEILNVRVVRTEQLIQNHKKLVQFIIDVLINTNPVTNNG